MQELAENELVVIRHAPAETGGRMAGRRDVPARIDAAAAQALAARLGRPAHLACSPALRCRQTAEALWPGAALQIDPRLWEQDFGAHEGLPYAELPDLGPLTRAQLARIAAPGGESFAAMVARVTPALQELTTRARRGGPVVMLAHAGTARAALALALGDTPAALAFEIAPLSLTRLRCLDDGLSIVQVAGAPVADSQTPECP